MTIKVAIRHQTTYSFDKAVSLSPHVFRLRPAVHCRTPITAYSLNIKPETHFINWQQDPFGNILARVVFPDKCRELSIDVEVIADLTVINPFDFFVESSAEKFPFDYEAQLEKELQPYLEKVENGPLLLKWVAEFDAKPMYINDFLVTINRLVFNKVSYNIRMEVGIQTSDETLEKGQKYYNSTQNCEKLFVFYSGGDEVLKWSYRLAEWDKALGSIGAEHPDKQLLSPAQSSLKQTADATQRHLSPPSSLPSPSPLQSTPSPPRLST